MFANHILMLIAAPIRTDQEDHSIRYRMRRSGRSMSSAEFRGCVPKITRQLPVFRRLPVLYSSKLPGRFRSASLSSATGQLQIAFLTEMKKNVANLFDRKLRLNHKKCRKHKKHFDNYTRFSFFACCFQGLGIAIRIRSAGATCRPHLPRTTRPRLLAPPNARTTSSELKTNHRLIDRKFP